MKFLYFSLLIFSLFVISCSDTTGSTEQNNCVVNGCNADQICNKESGKCEAPKRCTETGCSDDKICNETTGLCEEKPTCLTDGCPSTQYCDPPTGECKDNCYEEKCATNETCDILTGLCEPDCSKVTCEEHFKCDTSDALCKAECLNSGACEVTEYCNETTGICDLNCPEGKCAANEKCAPLTGECEIDCSSVTCQENSQMCDPLDGVCKPICEVNKCENKQACNPTSGLCEESILSQYQTECTENEDCLSGLCIQVGENKFCSLKCELADEDGCGDNWDCYPYNGESICAPILNYSCDSCDDDSDCSVFGGKCVEIDGVKSCLDSCKYSEHCNTGFSCNDTDIAGDIFKLCSPIGNSCDCNNDNLNLTLNCDITNNFGTCSGNKICTENGWSDCNGTSPSEEVCDNIDNDCDGIIDNVAVKSCENTNEMGTCVGNLICVNGVESCDARIPSVEVCNGIDDNCNNEVDELDDLGCRVTNEIGFCTGVQSCQGAQGWGECNASTPALEVCDGIDNDCNNEIDENLDGSCEITNEFGTCSGERRCLGQAGWDDCDALNPSYDICDGVDNNCNEQIDEENEHLFDSCSNMVNAELSCENGQCKLISCNINYYNLDNDDSNGCEYSCTFDTFQDIPDGIDHNCDGIDGNINDAYFVSSRVGSNSNNGTMSSPFKTISYAINQATVLGYTQIIVAAGDYAENLSITNDGVSIFGGYDDISWERNINANISKIMVAAHGITCTDVTQDTYIDGFTINSANASVYPENSIGINILNSGNNLKLQNLIINAGNGMSGLNGNQIYIATKGADGGNGLRGGNGSNDDEDAPGAGGAGGKNAACPSANGGNGGGGGKDNHHSGYSGANSAAGISGGSGGSGSANNGSAGSSATVSGANGANGLGGTALGDIITGNWVGKAGNNGSEGMYGKGGGGGGGGAAQYGTWVNDGAGAGGGGGAAGGCGGQGGAGGKAGTASFGIFLNNSNPTLNNVHINAGQGGNGGQGGAGALGGSPGNIGGGGSGGESGNGGNGGYAKAGGAGGAGGGGAGGVSYCIYRFSSNPNLNSWTCTTSLGGNGGGAGSASGFSGENGVSGDIY